ncbi:hypothetical protein [Ruminococcus flavefaciens]|uniref:hypothetical protein n=1 Tax=Ruminococcus flavefaciens TaxID=1265 RepID=UPI0019678642|nr:hypothetical protein [Ruminococcus flavefaciens]
MAMVFDRNENRKVAVLLGAGSMGTAILRRVCAGMTLLFGDISEMRWKQWWWMPTVKRASKPLPQKQLSSAR